MVHIPSSIQLPASYITNVFSTLRNLEINWISSMRLDHESLQPIENHIAPKKKYHTTCLPSMQPWTGESTHLLIQAPPFSADKSHKKKHDLCKRSTFYFLYKKLMHNCWNTSHKQCVQPQRDHRNFMVIKIKLCEQKSQYDTTQGLQMNTCRHWRPPGTIR